MNRLLEIKQTMASMLSRLLVIKSNKFGGDGYAYYNDTASRTVLLGEPSVFSTLVKIEVERAKSNSKYVHLRFSHYNKYWQQNENNKFIVAQSNKPEEDTTKPSCTLFEPFNVDGNGSFFLTHVHSGRRVTIDATYLTFCVVENYPTSDEQDAGVLTFVDWETLVKLPKTVAFKGFNGSYLGGIWSNDVPYLQFSVDDPNTAITTYKADLLPDGHIRIYSNFFNRYWRRSDSNWIVGESDDVSSDDANTVFWPVKLDDTTIALRNAGNNRFCICHDDDGKTRCLSADAPNITNEAKIVVQELVMERKIYNVRYRMEDARIFDETPFLAGRTTAFNYGDKDASIAVELNYEDQKSHSFSRSLSITAGVKTTFEAGIPFIEKATIEVSLEINTTFEWNDTRTTTTSAKATGTVTVPPKSMASVSYVGTMGTCDVPFSYTQQDKSSSDGSIIETDLIDGVFKGVNCYNYTFVVDKTQPLP